MKSSSAIVVLCLMAATLLVDPCLGLRHPRTRYQYFDDYLRHMDSEQQAIISDEAASPTADDGEDDGGATTTPATTTTGWQNQRDITCCMLGQIAGDKGYHCFAKFYAARLLMRNRNRAHNRKMSFYGRNRIPDYGRKVMRTFEQCVVGDRGVIFHKCCHLVAVERRDRIRYNTTHQAEPSTSGEAATTNITSGATVEHHHQHHHHQ